MSAAPRRRRSWRRPSPRRSPSARPCTSPAAGGERPAPGGAAGRGARGEARRAGAAHRALHHPGREGGAPGRRPPPATGRCCCRWSTSTAPCCAAWCSPAPPAACARPAWSWGRTSTRSPSASTPPTPPSSRRSGSAGTCRPSASREAKAAWTFLTGSDPDIRAVTDAVGFRYAYDERTRQFAHVAVLVVLTPGGRVSRYLYGVEFPSKDVRLALVEASEGRVGHQLRPPAAHLLPLRPRQPQVRAVRHGRGADRHAGRPGRARGHAGRLLAARAEGPSSAAGTGTSGHERADAQDPVPAGAGVGVRDARWTTSTSSSSP